MNDLEGVEAKAVSVYRKPPDVQWNGQPQLLLLVTSKEADLHCQDQGSKVHIKASNLMCWPSDVKLRSCTDCWYLPPTSNVSNRTLLGSALNGSDGSFDALPYTATSAHLKDSRCISPCQVMETLQLVVCKWVLVQVEATKPSQWSNMHTVGRDMHQMRCNRYLTGIFRNAGPV